MSLTEFAPRPFGGFAVDRPHVQAFVDLYDVEHECHGCERLPHEGCRCVVEPVRPTRRRAPAITPKEAREMLTPVATQPDAEAPYGRKADGSPRKKPGRPAKVVAAAAAPAQAKMNTALAEPAFIAAKRAEIEQRLMFLGREARGKRKQRDELNARLHEIEGEVEKLRKLQEALA